MNPGIILLIVLGIALLGLFAYLGWKAEQKRREELQALADELGFRFYPDVDHDHDDEYAHFAVFRKGHSRVARNTLVGSLRAGERNISVKAGDFRYKITSGSGKNQSTTTYRFSYLIAHMPFRSVPDLFIRPEGFFDRVAGAFGFDDIDFESEEFSRAFYVKSSDKRFAYDVIHARMMQYLLDSPRTTIDMEHGQCCICEGSKRWDVATFRARFDFLLGFIDRWPEHLVDELETH